ncbi:MAG: hypothetical protein QXI07_09000 [Pyrobaculum sp.]
MYYVATTTLTPLEVEDGRFVRVGSAYALISRRPRFRATLTSERAMKTVEVQGTPVEDVDKWLWDMRLKAFLRELERGEEDVVEQLVDAYLAEIKKTGRAEIPADSRDLVAAALRLYEQLSGRCDVKYYAVAAKYVFNCA